MTGSSAWAATDRTRPDAPCGMLYPTSGEGPSARKGPGNLGGQPKVPSGPGARERPGLEMWPRRPKRPAGATKLSGAEAPRFRVSSRGEKTPMTRTPPLPASPRPRHRRLGRARARDPRGARHRVARSCSSGPTARPRRCSSQRLAEALGLAFRHYNASILSFDDLLGYPVPQDGRLVYLETPATIWQAEAVLFDEVSRCRPELQNKLFPLIHEKVAQGTAAHPAQAPLGGDEPAAGEPGARRGAVDYDGAEPLDVALADRFAFVLEVPSLDQLGEDDRRAVLLGGRAGPTPGAADAAPGRGRAATRPPPRGRARAARATRPSTSTSSPRSSPPRATRSPPGAP